MVGILIIAHGELGEAMISCATFVLGARPARVESLSTAGGDPEALLARARGAIARLDDGAGVLVLTDMLGGTPSNVAGRTVEPGRVEAIAGLSLPMLLRLITYRNESLASARRKAVSGGREGVCNLGECAGAPARRRTTPADPAPVGRRAAG